MNDFEQSLKEQADNFQMVPSRKVWHGIYNDLHPGKRWPSFTMSFLLIFTLVVIGHLNTNNSRRSAFLTNQVAEANKLTAELKKRDRSTTHHRIVVRKTDLDKSRKAFVYSTGQSNNTGLATGTSIRNFENDNVTDDRLLADNLTPGDNSSSSFFDRNLILNPQPNIDPEVNNLSEKVYNNETPLQNTTGEISKSSTLQRKPVATQINNQSTNKTLTGKKNNTNSDAQPANKNIDNILSVKETPAAEIKKVKLHKKRNDKINWVYFAAPVVSSVSFGGETLKQSPGVNFSPGLGSNQKENKVLHSSALGMEAGAQMNYSLTKKLQFTAGAHLTYTGYNIMSNEVHPTFATLVLRDPATGSTYSRSYITHYGDGTGQAVVTIHNYNWQVSLPLGLQYEISGNNKIQFNAGASLEPSLVLKSNAYILASDGNNYLNDPSLLRKWNINSNFGAFVTFRSSKFKWQIGPNVRYQWLSTYRKEYTVKEHLIDYGIRIGISR